MVACFLYWETFKQLLLTELSVFSELFFDKLVDLFIWVALTSVIFGYVMPAFGLAADYGVFQLAGMVASAGLFEVFPSVMALVGDIEGEQVIGYHLSLPVPSWVVLLKTAASYAIQCMVLCLSVLPMGKLVLWNQFDMSGISYGKLVLVCALGSMFYGIFTLWITSMTANVAKVGNVWMRFIFPLWFMGGFQFSWKVLHGLFPVMAYINLLNPMVYIMEATRAAILGQEASLPFWWCIGALALFIIIFWVHAYARLKKRLDFV